MVQSSEIQIFQLPTGSYVTRAAFAFRGGRFRDKRQFASTAVLVTHPKGDALIDAGFGIHASEHIAMLPSYQRSEHELGTPASAQLDAAGYDRSRLLGVIPTHSHWDHVSGLDSLDVPIYLTRAEQDYAEHSKTDTVFQAVAPGHRVVDYDFDGPSYLGFPASHDQHGDGSVVIVPAGGHTTGSVIVFVMPSTGTPTAFVGDLVWQLDGISRGVERPLFMRMLADSDAGQVRRDLARIRSLADRMRIVPAHDARAYEGIPLMSSWRAAGEAVVS